ncbi:MAG: hypothetical protein ACI8QD_001802 [Cyclobacteriaceae bacterium]|jgi:hypothetical protein
MRSSAILIISILLPSFWLSAQELNCKVVINADQVQITERNIFTEMETAFADFLNNTKWTDDEFNQEEKINCNIILTLNPELSEPASGRYAASVQILSSRPVFNSSYESVLFNFGDKDWVFEYLPSQPLFFNENAFTSNITSLLAYYAYTVIGFDYDSFSSMGGDPYFQKAWQIVNLSQQQGYVGWDQFNNIRNRYWLIENILNTQMIPLREAYYDYHRLAMDIFSEEPEDARKIISDALKKVLNVNQVRPRAVYTVSFLDAKTSELNQVFAEGDPALRRNVYNLLINIDPTARDKFEALIK